MYDEDIEVLSAVAIPIGRIRDVYGEVEDNHDRKPGLSSTEQSNLFLLGIAITAVLILAVVLYMHMRLRHQYSLFEKDKVEMSAGRKALHNILNKIVAPIGGESKNDKEIEMSRKGLMAPIDEDLED